MIRKGERNKNKIVSRFGRKLSTVDAVAVDTISKTNNGLSKNPFTIRNVKN